jgi:hypothetical protein
LAIAVIALIVSGLAITGVGLLLPVSGLCQTATVYINPSDRVHCLADAPYQAVSAFIIVALMVVCSGFVGYLAFTGVG